MIKIEKKSHICSDREGIFPLAQVLRQPPYHWYILDSTGFCIVQHIVFCPWCGDELEKNNE